MVRCAVQQIDVFTDGGCHGNPGPGGWAYVIEADGQRLEASGGEPNTTNNRMELEAVIQALRAVAQRSEAPRLVTVHTDSQYVKNGITTWIRTWMKNGWKTAAKKPVKNQDRWIRLHELESLVGPEWKWVRGHAGNELNERCDELVQQAIARLEG